MEVGRKRGRSEATGGTSGGATEAPVDAVAEQLRVYRQLREAHGREVELEIRVGSLDEGDRFLPGVSKQVFLQLEEDMANDPQLTTRGEHWSEMVDYHYTGRSGEAVRTRVSADADRMLMEKEHVSKRLVSRWLVRRTDGCTDDVARVALSHEAPVTDPPKSCVPTHVRIKQRRVFVDRRAGEMGVVWSYELSKTWSASTRAAAEHKQHVCEPMYEVECELVDETGRYAAGMSDADLRASLCMKVRCLLGMDDRAELSCVGDMVAPRLAGEARAAPRARRVGQSRRAPPENPQKGSPG